MKSLSLLLLIFFTSTSAFLSVLIYNITGSSFAFSFPAINDAMLLILGLLSVINLKIKYNGRIYFSIISVLIALLFLDFLLLTGADFSSKLFSLRRIISLIAALVIGLNLFQQGFTLKRYFNLHYSIFFMVALFGLVEYFLNSSFWDQIIKLPEYWKAEGDIFAATKGTVEASGKFYSYDLYPFIGQKVRRMVSFYTEAKPLASYCIFLFPFIYFIESGLKRNILLLLVIVVGVLTFSKGFVLVVLLCYSQVFIKINPSFFWYTFIVFLGFGATIYYLGIGIGPLSHLNGLYSGFLVFLNGKFLGAGLGTSGNYSSELLESLGGGESGYGALMAQVGIGALLFQFYLYVVSKKIYKYYKQTNSLVYYATFICLFGWYINFLYSEAALGFRGNIFVFLTIGLVLSLRRIGSYPTN